MVVTLANGSAMHSGASNFPGRLLNMDRYCQRRFILKETWRF